MAINTNPAGPWSGNQSPDGSVATSLPDAGNTSIGWGTASVTSQTVLFTVDTTGYANINIQTTSIGGGATITWQGSNDNATWLNTSGFNESGGGPSVGYTTNTTGVGSFTIPLTYRYFRANCTTYTSGTVTVFYCLRTFPVYQKTTVLGVNLPASLTAASTGGYTYNNQTANTAGTTIKSGAGTLHSVVINTPGAADTITMFDNTTASGTKIGTINDATTEANTLLYDIAFLTGLSVTIAGTTAPDVTFCYK